MSAFRIVWGRDVKDSAVKRGDQIRDGECGADVTNVCSLGLAKHDSSDLLLHSVHDNVSALKYNTCTLPGAKPLDTPPAG